MSPDALAHPLGRHSFYVAFHRRNGAARDEFANQHRSKAGNKKWSETRMTKLLKAVGMASILMLGTTSLMAQTSDPKKMEKEGRFGTGTDSSGSTGGSGSGSGSSGGSSGGSSK